MTTNLPKFKQGLVIGKFYPPHRGHKFLIDTATSRCDHVTVIMCWKKTETISYMLRAQWLRKIHPTVTVMVVEDDHLADDDSEGWAKFTVKLLGYVPDAVFTSEDYGDPYAKFMGCVHVSVDKDRVNVPISATKVRSNPVEHLSMLEPCVRSYFTRRICIIGAESTGTTTLAKALAAHYQTVWAPEYGRLYSEAKMLGVQNNEWTSEEFEHIAAAQNHLENALAKISKGMLICDTNAFATSVWHERYLGERSSRVELIANECVPDLYIVTGDEIPFVQDGTRDGEHIRHWMHERFVERLREDRKPFIIVTGTPEERLQAAIKAIEPIRL